MEIETEVTTILGFGSLVAPGTRSILNPGIHGHSEITSVFASSAQNTGSAIASLSANTPWYTRCSA